MLPSEGYKETKGLKEIDHFTKSYINLLKKLPYKC